MSRGAGRVSQVETPPDERSTSNRNVEAEDGRRGERQHAVASLKCRRRRGLT